MKPEAWVEIARSMPIGSSRKIKHCGTDASMRLYHTPKGVSAHCFRCGHHPFVRNQGFNLKDLAKRRDELCRINTVATTTTELALPSDVTYCIPDHARVWFLKGGVNTDMAAFYRMGFSPTLNRVVLPVYEGTRLNAYICRALNGEKPKYIAFYMNGVSNAVFKTDTSTMLPAEFLGDTAGLPDYCITEDILSAVRCGRIVRSRALLGTAIRNAGDLGIPQGSTVAVWTDPDKAGYVALVKQARRLDLEGIKVRLIRSERDPKYYSNQEIKEYLTDRRRPSADAQGPERV
jgi:hypothetical protein